MYTVNIACSNVIKQQITTASSCSLSEEPGCRQLHATVCSSIAAGHKQDAVSEHCNNNDDDDDKECDDNDVETVTCHL